MKILISDAFASDLPDRLARFGEVFDDKDRRGEATVVLIRSKTKVTKEYLEQAPNLKLVIRGGVGLDNVDKVACKERGVEVRNTPEASSIAVAEQAFALMIAMPNHVIKAHNSMREGKWLKKELKRTELYGKTLGLIGVGRIGSEVARRAKAFGMRVVAYRESGKPHDDAEVLGSLDEVLAVADYVSLHTPFTDATNKMINEGSIAKMKQGVFIVNTGRGKCVDEAAVAAALSSGKIAGYANDVWYSDPPESSPLIDAPNVVLAPHIGGSTAENLGRIGDCVVAILEERKS